jgi:hypothetical protein
MLFQYQAGPRWSYFEISSIENGLDGANCGGSWIVGVSGSERYREIDDANAASDDAGGEVG